MYTSYPPTKYVLIFTQPSKNKYRIKNLHITHRSKTELQSKPQLDHRCKKEAQHPRPKYSVANELSKQPVAASEKIKKPTSAAT